MSHFPCYCSLVCHFNLLLAVLDQLLLLLSLEVTAYFSAHFFIFLLRFNLGVSLKHIQLVAFSTKDVSDKIFFSLICENTFILPPSFRHNSLVGYKRNSSVLTSDNFVVNLVVIFYFLIFFRLSLFSGDFKSCLFSV